jgi:hypothetical protein
MATSPNSILPDSSQSQNRPRSSIAMRAALAIINSTVNPALRHDASNVTAPRLAEVIERETQVSTLVHELGRTADYLEWVLQHNITQDAQREECQYYIDDARKAMAKATGGAHG